MMHRVLYNILEPLFDEMSSAFASLIATMRVNDDDLRRIEELRLKANSGDLADDEMIEYREFVEAIDFIALLQSRDRKIVGAHASENAPE